MYSIMLLPSYLILTIARDLILTISFQLNLVPQCCGMWDGHAVRWMAVYGDLFITFISTIALMTFDLYPIVLYLATHCLSPDWPKTIVKLPK